MQEKRARETYLYAPLRRVAAAGSFMIKNLLGRVVKVFNKKKGNEMLARTGSGALQKKVDAADAKHHKAIDKIHDKYSARKPLLYYGSGAPVLSNHYW